jgi:hypothetical protein
MYNYRWTIVQIQGYPEIDQMQNVIGKVYWELEVRDPADHSIHYLRESTDLSKPNSTEGFIDFLEVDGDIVFSWLWAIIGKEETEARAAQALDDLRAPKLDQLTPLAMPWANECCPDGQGFPG